MIVGECREFELCVRNVGDCAVEHFYVCIDHADCLAVFDCPSDVVDDVMIIRISGEFEGEVCARLKFVLRARDVGRDSVHAFVAVRGKPIAYYVRKMEVSKCLVCTAQHVTKGSDTSSMAFRGLAMAGVSGVSLIGAFTKSGHFFRTTFGDKELGMVANEKVGFVGFSGVRSEKVAEEWRLKLMEESFISVLFRVPGVALPVQYNLKFEEQNKGCDMKLEMPSQVSARIGDSITCKVKLVAKRRMFVQTMPFEFVDYSKKRDFGGLRWMGITKKELSEENGYECDFVVKVLAFGVYRLKGFHVLECSTGKAGQVDIGQMINVQSM
jgi:hypothetical protein